MLMVTRRPRPIDDLEMSARIVQNMRGIRSAVAEIGRSPKYREDSSIHTALLTAVELLDAAAVQLKRRAEGKL